MNRNSTDYVTDNLQMAGRVKRYACWPTIHQQTVGEHSWQVYRIYCNLFGRPNADVTYYIMHHDSAELITGDPPFPVKRDNPDLKAAFQRVEVEANERLGVRLPAILIEELDKIKVCDLLEMTEFGMSEREMGNHLAAPIVQRTSEGALKLAKAKLSPDLYDEVERYVKSLWRRHDDVIAQAHITYKYNYTREIERLLEEVSK